MISQLQLVVIVMVIHWSPMVVIVAIQWFIMDMAVFGSYHYSMMGFSLPYCLMVMVVIGYSMVNKG